MKIVTLRGKESMVTLSSPVDLRDQTIVISDNPGLLFKLHTFIEMLNEREIPWSPPRKRHTYIDTAGDTYSIEFYYDSVKCAVVFNEHTDSILVESCDRISGKKKKTKRYTTIDESVFAEIVA